MINVSTEILAKSQPPVSLKQHISECLSVYKSLRKAFGRLPLNDVERFWMLLRFGIIFHDLGKAHPEFQKVLLGKKGNWYSQRHELFSVPFINQLDLPDEDKILLKLIVAGHHKDFNSLFDFIQHSYKNGEDFLSFSEDGKLDWDEELSKLDTKFIESFLQDYGLAYSQTTLSSPFPQIKSYFHSHVNSANVNFRQLLLSAGALKQCDHMASAGIFKINILEDQHFEFLYNTKWPLYHHQKKADETLGNIVLIAPTGSGKTEASLMWLQHQIKESGQGRTFYILPFTASINAMYERLDNKMQGNSEIVGLLHGKLSEYIESRFEEERFSVKNDTLKKELKESYRALVPPLKVTTPFQLLKYIFGLKGFEKGIFEMAGGYFIFDEIHAYDPEVTSQIKVLIEFATQFLNINVCLMTATLPTFLKREFEGAIGTFTEITANSKLYQSFIRHRIKVAKGLLSDHIEDIQQRLNKGDKVLVVCNTVKQAQHIYKQLKVTKKVLLHSAFNGIDRNKKEAELKSEEVKLLVGTQAIEVSLDIDYHVIFTELAPLDALLQRFGRINRHQINGIYRPPCDCIVFAERNDVDKYIYRNEEIISRTLEALRDIETLNSGVIAEIELQKYIDRVYPKWTEKDQADFDRVYNHLKIDVMENLAPFIYDSHREEDFEKQFDGIKVLPIILVSEYKKSLEQNKFIKAESLKVQINHRRFVQFLRENKIFKETIVLELLKNEKLIEQNTYIIDSKYDSILGLQIDIEENMKQDKINIL